MGIISWPGGGSLKAKGRPSPLFSPSKFDDRRKIVLQIVAGVGIEPSQIQTTGSKRLKEGSKLYDREYEYFCQSMRATVNFF